MFYLLPFIAALIGWFFNWIMIKLIFHPHLEMNILGLKLQGVFPGRRTQLAQQLGAWVAAEFISFEKITAKLQNPDIAKNAMPFIEEKIDGFIKVKLKEEMPLLSMFIKDDSLNGIKQGMVKEIENMFPVLILKLTDEMKEDLDIEKLVCEKIESINTADLEQLMLTGLKREMMFVQVVGALAGFLIGWILLASVSFI